MMNQQENKNSLPKYWVVQCNTFDPNWRKVIDYLKNVHGEKWEGVSEGTYYGYDGGLSCWNGTNVYNNIGEFTNNPTLLTIEQFVEMTEGNVIPEYVECIEVPPGWSLTKEGKIYKTDFAGYSKGEYRILFNTKDGNGGQGITTVKTKSCFIPSTKEAFDKQQQKPKETMKTITHTQAQSIIDIACTTWKEKLFTLWGKKIVLKQEVEISDNQYQEMRKACTSDQNELFDTIFGKDKPKFKVGDWVYWSGNKPITAQIVREATYDRDCWVLNEKTHDSCYQDLIRPATEEEIQKAQYIPEGTPCLGRDGDAVGWRLCYSTGDGLFKWTPNNKADKFKEIQVLDMNNLPKY